MVTQEGDTLRGLVEKASNSKLCRFKIGQIVTEYPPGSIKAYGFDNERFFVSNAIDNVFARVLVTGSLNLYENDQELYIEKPGNDRLINVKPKGEEVLINGVKSIQRDTKWVGFLVFFVEDCSDLSEKVEKVKANSSSIISFIQEYTQCRNGEFKDYRRKFRPDFSISLGTFFSDLKVKEQSGAVAFGHSEFNSIGFQVGGAMAFYPFWSAERFGFEIGANVLFSTLNENRPLPDTGNLINQVEDTEIKLNIASIPVTVNFKQPLNNKHYLLLKVGITLNQQQSSSIKGTVNRVDRNTNLPSSSERYDLELTDSQVGMITSAGWYLPSNRFNWGLELFFNSQPGISTENAAQFTSNTSFIGLKLNAIF